MCERHSFLLLPDGRIVDGLGFTDSHTQIALMHGVDEDVCNKYEARPTGFNIQEPDCWRIRRDTEVFITTSENLGDIHQHLRCTYTSYAEWLKPDRLQFDAFFTLQEKWYELWDRKGFDDIDMVVDSLMARPDSVANARAIHTHIDIVTRFLSRAYGLFVHSAARKALLEMVRSSDDATILNNPVLLCHLTRNAASAALFATEWLLFVGRPMQPLMKIVEDYEKYKGNSRCNCDQCVKAIELLRRLLEGA